MLCSFMGVGSSPSLTARVSIAWNVPGTAGGTLHGGRVTVHNAARVSQPAGSRGGSHWPTSLAAHAARHSADTWHPLPQPTPDTFSPRPGLDAEQRRGTHVFFPSKSSASTSVTDGLHPSPRHALHVGKRAGGAVGARAVPVARQGANGARVGDAAHAVAAGITRLLARAV